jgi:polyhydroxyalkanoate synthesis regulator phasin
MADGSRRPAGIADALRRYVDALASVTEVPRNQAERIVSDLAERGELRARDLQRSARELAERSAKNRRELAELIRKEIRRQIAALGVATKTDIDRLNKRVRELEKPKTTAKRAPAKAKGTKGS